MTPLQKLPKTVGDLGKLIVAKGFEKLPKVQSGHTAENDPHAGSLSRILSYHLFLFGSSSDLEDLQKSVVSGVKLLLVGIQIAQKYTIVCSDAGTCKKYKRPICKAKLYSTTFVGGLS